MITGHLRTSGVRPSLRAAVASGALAASAQGAAAKYDLFEGLLGAQGNLWDRHSPSAESMRFGSPAAERSELPHLIRRMTDRLKIGWPNYPFSWQRKATR